MSRWVYSFLIFISLSFYGYNQSKFYTKNGIIAFVSETPFITLKAYNKDVVSFLDTASGEIVVGVVMKAFKFKRPLAQDHFNENYAETDIYPNSKFKGKIIIPGKITEGVETEVVAEGDLTIHGVTKKISEKATLLLKKNQIIGESSFVLHPEDFNIKIPSLVSEKIARDIQVKVKFTYKPYKE